MVASYTLIRLLEIAVFFVYMREKMINGYMSINEIAKKWNLSPRRVRAMCSEGLIKGAAKLGKSWAIPVDAERPVDGRITTGEYINWRKKNE